MPNTNTQTKIIRAGGKLKPLISIKCDDEGNPPKQLEVLRTGMWEAPYHGDFMITPQDIQEYIDHFMADVRPSSSTEGLPIDQDHDAGAAAGWMKTLRSQANDAGGLSLWADVSWTAMGKQKIADEEYKFFSPEFVPVGYIDPEGIADDCDNVLIGGGLTNRPLFKDLQAVTASDSTRKASGPFSKMYIKAKETIVPNLDEVRVKDLATLSPEEKQLLADNKDQLSADEQKKFELSGDNTNPNPETPSGDGGTPDGGDGGGSADTPAGEGADAPATPAATPAAPVAGSDKNVVISASELKDLKDAAAKGISAHDQLERKKADDHITGLCFDERKGFKFASDLKPELVSLYISADEKQKATLDKLFESASPIMAADQMGARGSGQDADVKAAATQITAKAEEIVKADESGRTSFSEALLQVRRDNPELTAAADAEYQSGKPQLASR